MAGEAGAGDDGPSLTIGEVADRTGVAQATLRMWETRYGFPRPERLGSGHRRYVLADVDAILDVVRRRDAGVRLDVAIRQALRASTAEVEPDRLSVFAELRRRHPHLATHRLHKPTLLALSWAIEDEVRATAQRAFLFGAFQRAPFLQAALPRWVDLALVARAAFVFADAGAVVDTSAAGPGLVAVPLSARAPLRREWVVVCDGPRLAVVLSAWELPGQDDVPDRQRLFESTWTLEPLAVRDAARVCARAAVESGSEEAALTLRELAGEPASAGVDPTVATAMFNRVVAYGDRFAFG